MPEEHAAIVMYGTHWCPDCRRSKQFLGEQRIHYHWVDIEQEPHAMAYVQQVNQGQRSIPTIVFPDGSILVEPSNAELAEKLGLQTKAARTFYDVIIVGGGPAGLAAAIYTAREGLDTLVVEKGAPGGQAATSQIIDNFPGFDEGISGDEFSQRLSRQADRFGVEILQAQEVRDVRIDGRYREILTADGSRYGSDAVLIATGAHYRRLDVPGEAELVGINIHFCATCDGAFYKNKPVLVVGGGNSAFEEGLFLTKFASHVTIVARDKATASRILQDKVAGRTGMSLLTDHVVQAFIAEDGRLAGVRALDKITGDVVTMEPEGVFVFIGMTPNSGFLPAEFERDRYGFLITDRTMQTSLKGIFAAGDVRAGATAQAASAAGEGVTAALMIRDYLREYHH